MKNIILIASVLTSFITLAKPEFRPIRNFDFIDNGNPNPNKVELGKLLFFDKILSGNKNISCATCHHPETFTSDALSLSIGEGGTGLGENRNTGIGSHAVHERVPRNSPAIFNLGAKEYINMFADGRVFHDENYPSGFKSPAGHDLPEGLENILAAQAMFPVTSNTEMAGQEGENSIADAATRGDLSGPYGVWNQLARRVQQIPGYVDHFKKSFDDIRRPTDIKFSHIANAIAAFENKAFMAINSPFDKYLAGNYKAMSEKAHRGRKLFYGKARCFECHSGPLQTDHKFYAIGMPQIGPGKGDGLKGREDFGRKRVTGKDEDLFKFRTPTLRNVMLTGPWGHAGAYTSMEQVIFHHTQPFYALFNYDESQVVLPYRRDLSNIDFYVMNNLELINSIARRIELPIVVLTNKERDELVSFMHALTDRGSRNMGRLIPREVPSGLPVKD